MMYHLRSSALKLTLFFSAAGTGINLTRGSHCYLMDPWWNAAAEDQAFDRIHRMGQTRPVKIYRLVMAESIEGKLIKLQQRKAAMGKGSLEKLSAKEQERAKVTAMRDLFDTTEQKDCKGDFYYDSDDDFILDDDYE